MAGVTTFPVVPRPGALRCREAEHSSPAALARGRSGLRLHGANAPIPASAPRPAAAPWHGLSQCPNAEPGGAARPDSCLPLRAWGILLARKLGGGQEWSQTSMVCRSCWLANGSLASHGAAQKMFLSGSSNSRTCGGLGGPFTGARGLLAGAVGRRKLFRISGLSLVWGRDADVGKARPKRALDPPGSLLVTQHETQPSPRKRLLAPGHL